MWLKDKPKFGTLKWHKSSPNSTLIGVDACQGLRVTMEPLIRIIGGTELIMAKQRQ